MERPTPIEHPRRLVEPLARGVRRSPTVVLVVVVGVATLVYGSAAQRVPMPLVNPDELRYTMAASAIVDGEWLNLRGREYGYGALYPMVLASILALADGVETAYPFFKLANALLFALAAVPIFFLARRLLSARWSVAVASMSVAIPSSIYTSLVMTESVSYLLSSTAVLAVVLALERTSVTRQLAMLGAIGLAFTARPQFAALLPAFLAGHLLLWSVDAQRRRLRRVADAWPTFAAVAVCVAAVTRHLVTASSSTESSGGYDDLWRSYDVVAVARLAMYHLAGLELYLFVIPFVVAPVVIAALLRAGRRGSRREGAFAAAFLVINGVFVLIAAAFASTPYGWQVLHDRYLFYVAPLWLVVFARWLSQGLPRPRLLTAGGVVAGLALTAFTPFGLLTGDIVFEYVPTALWSSVWTFVEGTPHLDGRRVLGATVVALATVGVVLPRRFWLVLPAAVVAGFLLTSVLAWQRLAEPSDAFLLADDNTRAWVDDAVRDGSRTTRLYVSPRKCPYSELTRHAFFLTEFFNPSVDRASAIGDATPDGLPYARVDIGRGGRLVHPDGKPLVAEYVVADPGIELDARRVATGTGARLVLWETRGEVRLDSLDGEFPRPASGACNG